VYQSIPGLVHHEVSRQDTVIAPNGDNDRNESLFQRVIQKPACRPHPGKPEQQQGIMNENRKNCG
jgi:hypothetical protein